MVRRKHVDLVIIILVGLFAYFMAPELFATLSNGGNVAPKHRIWHKRYRETAKTPVNLFVTIWRIIVLFTVTYALLAVFRAKYQLQRLPRFCECRNWYRTGIWRAIFN